MVVLFDQEFPYIIQKVFMKIGFVCLPVSGHLYPMTAAPPRKLQSPGMRWCLSASRTPRLSLALRPDVLRLGEDRYPPGSIARMLCLLRFANERSGSARVYG